jgi:hypothetical protein
MVGFGRVGKEDPQQLVWFERAVSNGGASFFLKETMGQFHNFNCCAGHANVIFAIGRALKRHISNDERRTIFGDIFYFDDRVGPAK